MEFQNNENDLGFSFDIDGVEDTGTFDIELKEDAPSSAIDAAVKAITPQDGEGTEAEDATSEEGKFEVVLKDAVSGSEKEGDATFTLPNDKPSSDSAPSSPHLLTRLASALHKDGVLTDVSEEDIKNVDIPKLAEMIKGTIQKNEYSDLDSRAKEALDAIRAGVPIENVVKHHNAETKLADFTEDRFIESNSDDESIADSKKEIRQNLIYNDLIARGYSQADSERRTRQSFNSGDDDADAKLALDSLKGIATQRKKAEVEQAKQSQQHHEDSRKELFSKVAGIKEVLPGMPVNDDTAKWMAEAMTNPTGRNESGQLRTTVSDKRSEDAFSFDTRLHYFIKMGLFDENPDLSLFTRRSMSSAVEELEKSLSTEGIYEGGRGASLESITEREMKDNYLRMLDGADI